MVKKQSLESKFEEIAEDLSHNVTFVYGRNDIIRLADLVAHSVLSFDFRGERVHKGWVEGLLLGDTRVGKSRTLNYLAQHYRAGEFVTGEDLSKAGLVGGLQQIATRWNITWGKIPLLNRRMIWLDEINNLPPEVIADMSGMRSSGIAEITKIQTNKTEARTRALWSGNPRSNRYLSTFTWGIFAIRELIGNLDDIARFDIALTAAVEEVDEDEYNKADRKAIEHKYTSDRCHNLLMWAWSRKPEDVVFLEDSDLAVLQYAKSLSNEYTPQIPLVNASEMRFKLAKLSVSAAARVFSTDEETHSKVIVLPEHVEFIVDTIHQFYNKPSMGYDMFTKLKKEEEAAVGNTDSVEKMLIREGADFVDGLLNYEYIDLNDITDLSGTDREAGKRILSDLVKSKCLRKLHTNYIKSAAFNTLLRKLKNSGVLEKKLDTSSQLTYSGEDLF